MKLFIVICLLVSLPVCMTLNCYQCAAASRGCNDPFDINGADVSETGENSEYTYCKKSVIVGIVQRSGDTSCKPSGFTLDTGTTCCQTDLCNGAQLNFQIPLMLLTSLAVILIKMQWD